MDLYHATNGANWSTATNWFIGEPCVDGWFGVFCCPEAMPYLIGAETLDPEQQYCSATPQNVRRRLVHESGAANVSVTELPANGKHFCHHGSWHGNDTDLARCSVVQLLFGDNNLGGALSSFEVDVWSSADRRNFTFNNLQALSFENNAIGGSFPMWLTTMPRLSVVKFAHNNIAVNYDDEVAIRAMCEAPGVSCSGLPHNGGDCLAFGENAALIRPYDEHCEVCALPSSVLLRWYILLGVTLAALLLYVATVYAYARGAHGIACIKPPPPTEDVEAPLTAQERARIMAAACVSAACISPTRTTLKGWVACSCVIIFHYQTIMLLGAVRPIWPKTVQMYFACLSLDYQCFTIPECVTDFTPTLALNLSSRAGTDTILMVLICCPMAALCLTLAIRITSKLRGRNGSETYASAQDPNRQADGRPALMLTTTEFVCSALMVVPAATALRVARDQMTWGSESDSNGVYAALGALLFGTLIFVYSLWTAMAAVLQRSVRGSLQHPLQVPRLLKHLAYLTQPYRPSGASWQMISFVQHLVVFFAAWSSNHGLSSVSREALHGTAGERVVGSLVMVGVLMVMWGAHIFLEPWESAYQNAASSALYPCHIVAIGLGAIWNEVYDDAFFSSLVEGLLLLLLIAAPLVAMIYLALGVRVISMRTQGLTDTNVVAGTMPIWVRGMRWEEMPLPPATVAIPCVYEGSPSAQQVLEALNASMTPEQRLSGGSVGSKSSEDDMDPDAPSSGSAALRARDHEFTRSFSRLLDALAAENKGWSKSQSRAQRAQVSQARAKKNLVSKVRKLEDRLAKYKTSLEETFPGAASAAGAVSASAARAAGAVSAVIPRSPDRAADLADIDVNLEPGQIGSIGSLATVASAAVRLKRGRAIDRAAALTKELSDLLETDADELETELTPEELALLRKDMTLLTKLSARSQAVAKQALDARSQAVAKQAADTPPASPGRKPDETYDAQFAALAAATYDATYEDSYDVESAAAGSAGVSPPPSPPLKEREWTATLAPSASALASMRSCITSFQSRIDGIQNRLIAILERIAAADNQVATFTATWPAKANRFEPGYEVLDGPMTDVLKVIEAANYGTVFDGPERWDVRPLNELGYSVVLCLHQHYNVHQRQRWYLTVVDWWANERIREVAHSVPGSPAIGATSRTAAGVPVLLTMTNAYLPRGSDDLGNGGGTIVCDAALKHVYVPPKGSFVRVIHTQRVVDPERIKRWINALTFDLLPLIRNLRGITTVPPGSVTSALGAIQLDAKSRASELLDELTMKAEQLVENCQKMHKVGSPRALAFAFQRAMRDIVTDLTDDGGSKAALRDFALGGEFPKAITVEPWWHAAPGDKASMPENRRLDAGVSVHLCASDCRRLARDPSRDIVIWLTVTELDKRTLVRDPVQGAFAPRPSQKVPGELVCPVDEEHVVERLGTRARAANERAAAAAADAESSRVDAKKVEAESDRVEAVVEWARAAEAEAARERLAVAKWAEKARAMAGKTRRVEAAAAEAARVAEARVVAAERAAEATARSMVAEVKAIEGEDRAQEAREATVYAHIADVEAHESREEEATRMTIARTITVEARLARAKMAEAARFAEVSAMTAEAEAAEAETRAAEASRMASARAKAGLNISAGLRLPSPAQLPPPRRQLTTTAKSPMVTPPTVLSPVTPGGTKALERARMAKQVDRNLDIDTRPSRADTRISRLDDDETAQFTAELQRQKQEVRGAELAWLANAERMTEERNGKLAEASARVLGAQSVERVRSDKRAAMAAEARAAEAKALEDARAAEERSLVFTGRSAELAEAAVVRAALAKVEAKEAKESKIQRTLEAEEASAEARMKEAEAADAEVAAAEAATQDDARTEKAASDAAELAAVSAERAQAAERRALSAAARAQEAAAQATARVRSAHVELKAYRTVKHARFIDAQMMAVEAKTAAARLEAARAAQEMTDFRRRRIHQARREESARCASAALAFLGLESLEDLSRIAMPVKHDPEMYKYVETDDELNEMAAEAAAMHTFDDDEEEQADDGIGIGIAKGTLAAALASLQEETDGAPAEETPTGIAQAAIETGTVARARDAAVASAAKDVAAVETAGAQAAIESGTVARARAAALASQEAAARTKAAADKMKDLGLGGQKGKVAAAAAKFAKSENLEEKARAKKRWARLQLRIKKTFAGKRTKRLAKLVLPSKR